jgi:hypothetical protein
VILVALFSLRSLCRSQCGGSPTYRRSLTASSSCGYAAAFSPKAPLKFRLLLHPYLTANADRQCL